MTKNRPEVGLERAGLFIHHVQWQYPEGVQRFTVVDNSDFSPIPLTAL